MRRIKEMLWRTGSHKCVSIPCWFGTTKGIEGERKTVKRPWERLSGEIFFCFSLGKVKPDTTNLP